MSSDRMLDFSKYFQEFNLVKELDKENRELAVSSIKRYTKAFEKRQKLLNLKKDLQASNTLKEMQKSEKQIKNILKPEELQSILSNAVEKDIIYYNDLKLAKGLADKSALKSISTKLKQNIQIRQATAKDLNEIMELEKLFPAELQEDRREYEKIFDKHPEGNLVAVKHNRVLAYLLSIRLNDKKLFKVGMVPEYHSAKGEYTVIWSIATLASHQGLGVASQLIEKLILNEANREIITTTSRPINRFYEKLGFKEDGILEGASPEEEGVLVVTRKPMHLLPRKNASL